MKTVMTLDRLLDILGQHAHRVLLVKSNPELAPLYHICPATGPDIVVMCPWANEQEKLLALAMIKGKAREVGATMIGFLSETWMSKYNNPTLDLSKVPQPSQDPNRTEAVLAIVTDGHETKCRSWQIVRDRPDGAIIHLKQEEESPSQLSGRMIDGLLPRQPTRH